MKKAAREAAESTVKDTEAKKAVNTHRNEKSAVNAEKTGDEREARRSAKTSNKTKKDSFGERLDSWDKQTEGFSFVVGETSTAISNIKINGKKIGKKQIRLDATKIKSILAEHENMDIGTIKQLPDVIDNPIIVLDSKTVKGRLVLFGELYDKSNRLVLVALELHPTTRRGNSTYVDIIKIASAYGKGNVQGVLNDSTVRYIDENKNRVNDWLKVNRLQLPLPNSQSDSAMNIIPDSKQKINPSEQKNIKKSAKSSKTGEKATKSEVKNADVEENAPVERAKAAAVRGFCEEKIPEYNKLSEQERSAVRMTVRQALSHGMDERDRVLLGRIAAKSGMNIYVVKDIPGENATFDGGNGIYVSASAERGKVYSGLLGHEMFHKLFTTKSARKLYNAAFQNLDEEKRAEVINRYMEHYKKLEYSTSEQINISSEEAAAAYAEEVFSMDGVWEYVLSEEPSFKEKVLGFFGGAARRYSFDESVSKEARRWLIEYRKLFTRLAENNKGASAFANASARFEEKKETLSKGKRSAAKDDVDSEGEIGYNKKNDSIIYETLETKKTEEPENKNNLNANSSKGESVNEQRNQDSGILERRVLPAVSKSENDQRKRSDDTQNVYGGVAFNGDTSRFAVENNAHRKNSSGYLARTDIVSPYHFKRYQENVLRGLEGKLADRDSSGRSIPEEIKERFKNTVLKNENGELLSVFHWTNNIFNIFEQGDVGFHFGTYQAALNRRTGKSYEKGADRVKEVYLNIKNPIFLEDFGFWYGSEIASQLWERGLISFDELTRLQRTKGYTDGKYNDEASKAIRKVLDDLGYDGIMYQNATEGKGTLSVAALYPEQIYTVTEETVNSNNSKSSRELDIDSAENGIDVKTQEIDSKTKDNGKRSSLQRGRDAEGREGDIARNPYVSVTDRSVVADSLLSVAMTGAEQDVVLSYVSELGALTKIKEIEVIATDGAEISATEDHLNSIKYSISQIFEYFNIQYLFWHIVYDFLEKVQET